MRNAIDARLRWKSVALAQSMKVNGWARPGLARLTPAKSGCGSVARRSMIPCSPARWIRALDKGLSGEQAADGRLHRHILDISASSAAFLTVSESGASVEFCGGRTVINRRISDTGELHGGAFLAVQ
jgi:hypothetical protein